MPVMFNFLTSILVTELNFYNTNRKQIQLFLEKENSQKQEKQTGSVF
jgi:hypothetical protein